ncbi:hypothetical protein PLANTIT3_60078 [Plantibacter sp. T3]|nr:hypothetical protein PLANTIT3_60078 [Plantibacter sp. T3]
MTALLILGELTSFRERIHDHEATTDTDHTRVASRDRHGPRIPHKVGHAAGFTSRDRRKSGVDRPS